MQSNFDAFDLLQVDTKAIEWIAWPWISEYFGAKRRQVALDSKESNKCNHDLISIKFFNADSSHSSGSQTWTYAIDLIKAIRETRADVTIGVAGYVEVHHLAENRAEDLRRLKEKVDAGANFIITNVCFSFEQLVEFILSVRDIGITVPIIPGIFVPTTYKGLQKMRTICQFNVPSDQLKIFEQFKEDDERFRAHAIENAVHLLTQLFTFDEYPIYGVQFFTLNRYDHIVAVVEKCERFFGF